MSFRQKIFDQKGWSHKYCSKSSLKPYMSSSHLVNNYLFILHLCWPNVGQRNCLWPAFVEPLILLRVLIKKQFVGKILVNNYIFKLHLCWPNVGQTKSLWLGFVEPLILLRVLIKNNFVGQILVKNDLFKLHLCWPDICQTNHSWLKDVKT